MEVSNAVQGTQYLQTVILDMRWRIHLVGALNETSLPGVLNWCLLRRNNIRHIKVQYFGSIEKFN